MATNITCPSCKKQIAVRYKVNRYVGCSKCQTLVKVTGGHTTEISRKRKHTLKGSDLQLGDAVKLDGKLFYVVAQFRYEELNSEFDREERRYYTSRWSSDEWYLMNDELLSAWLNTDDEGMYRVSYFTPTTPMLPDRDKFLALEGGKTMHKAKEYGTRTLLAFAGEFPSLPTREKVVDFAMYEMNGHDVEVEWVKKGSKTEWVSFNRSKYISWDEQKKMFSSNDPNSKKNLSLRRFEVRNLAVYLCVFAAIICLLGAAITAGEGKELFIFTKNYSLNMPSTLVFTTPPFEFAEAGDVYSMDVSSSFGPSNNSDLEFSIKLLDANTEKLVNVIEGAFYMESGRDNEGYWTEVVAADSELFKIESAGKYFAEVTIYNTSTADSGVFIIRIVEKMLSRYYLAGLLVCLAILYLLHKTNTKYKRS